MAEANRERAMELFEKQRKARIRASMTPYNPRKATYCCDCNGRIPAARLKVQVRAARCQPCADAIERNGFV